ncbi:hypothetical protein C6361_29735 [Plantactinospora sp. BC1]|nr:hypothetical protein C6361_29735 [Plantactinospora sp. BC1]
MVTAVGAVLALLAGLVQAHPASAATTLIYATFKGDGAADQELWIYQSTNGGTNYSVLYDTNFRGPTGVLRDPSIIKRDGTYYIASTVQSWTTNSGYFHIASSTNLRDWTTIARVNSGVANTRFTWAPEFYLEGNTVRIIASVSQTTCASDCFKPYVYTAQNSGLTSWGGPTVMGGITGNHIDTFLVRSGSTYHAFTKAGNANIELWTSTSLTSGYAKRKNLYSGNFEGQSLMRMDNGNWRMYADRYTNGGIYTATSSDLVNWSSLTGPITCSGCRHGTAIPK